jgi:arabinose-5-phosphate isomerase
MVVSGDVVVLLSNSGRTRELVALVEPIKRLSVPLIAFLGNRDSTLGEAADVVLDVSVEEEACPMGLAPTASTTASLALGDALAMAVLEKKGFGAEDFRTLHPNGQIGFKLMRVEDAMHRGDKIPKVRADALMRDVIYEMSRKGLGVTSVVDGLDRLVGVISDGDLRRQLERDERLLTRTAGDCMTKNPVTVAAKEAATAALALMEKRRITSLMVPDEEGRIAGVLHLHDLWRLREYF